MTENHNPDRDATRDHDSAGSTTPSPDPTPAADPAASTAAQRDMRGDALHGKPSESQGNVQGATGPHAGPSWAMQSDPTVQGSANGWSDRTNRSAAVPQPESSAGPRPWVNPYEQSAQSTQFGSTAGPQKQKRRVPLVPAVLAGSALFVVGGLAGGAIGVSAATASNDSGTRQGPGGQNGPGGMGGQQGGAQDGGGMPGGQSNGGGMPGGQSNGVPGNQNGSTDSGDSSDGSSSDGSSSDGSSSDGSASDSDGSDASADTTSAGTDETTIENAAVTHFDQIFTGFAVLNRDE